MVEYNDDSNNNRGDTEVYDMHIIDAARMALQIINELKALAGGDDISEEKLLCLNDSHIIHVEIKPIIP